MLIDLLEPVLYVVKGLLVSAVIHQDDSHRALIVGLRDCAEALLAGRVPHLQLNPLIVYVDLFDLEIDTYYVNATDYYQWWACGSRGSCLRQSEAKDRFCPRLNLL